MKLEKNNLIVKRSYKEVYKTDEGIIKIFEPIHPKSAIFNEALNTVRVEETELEIPKLKEVRQIDGKWAIIIEYKSGRTLEEIMRAEPDNLEKYSDPETQEYQTMVDTICKKLNFTSLRYHRLDDMMESVGLNKCKLCTYCWDGKE